MKRSSEFEIEQQIFLGGQVSAKHDFFKELAMISPQYALPYLFLHNGKEIEEAKTEDEAIEKIIKTIGIATNMQNYTELTRLSMILGDTRKSYNLSGLKDELATRT